MDTISNNTSQVASVRTVTSLNYIKRAYNLSPDDSNSFEKQISEEAKSKVISEQQNIYPNPASFNYQYQHTVPVAVLSTASQPFNETAKPTAKDESSSEKDESEKSDYYVEESSGESQKFGLGFYLVDNSISNSSGGKNSQKLPNPMRDRLNKIYNLNFGIEPGTIVNVTCY